MRIPTLAILLMAWLCTTTAWGAGKPVSAATPEEQGAARDAYVQAMKRYDAGALSAALDGFRESYGIVASPNSHLMVARVLVKMGRSVDAFLEMRAVMREAEAASRLGSEYAAKYRKTLDTASALTAELRQKVGIVRVELEGGAALPQGATVAVAGQRLEDLREPAVVAPGSVEVVLATSTCRQQQLVQVDAGGEVTVRLQLPAVAPPPVVLPSPREEPEDGVNVPLGLAYGAAVLGAGGFVLFGIAGALTLDRFEELERMCPNNRCPLDAQPNIDDGHTFQKLANAGLGIGIAGAVTSLALFLVAADVEVSALRSTPDGLAIGGTF